MWQKIGQGPPPTQIQKRAIFSQENTPIYLFLLYYFPPIFPRVKQTPGRKEAEDRLPPGPSCPSSGSEFSLKQISVKYVNVKYSRKWQVLFLGFLMHNLLSNRYICLIFFNSCSFAVRNYLISEIFVIIFGHFYFVPFLWRIYLISEAIVKEKPEEEDKAKQVSPDIHLKNTMDYT